MNYARMRKISFINSRPFPVLKNISLWYASDLVANSSLYSNIYGAVALVYLDLPELCSTNLRSRLLVDPVYKRLFFRLLMTYT